MAVHPLAGQVSFCERLINVFRPVSAASQQNGGE